MRSLVRGALTAAVIAIAVLTPQLRADDFKPCRKTGEDLLKVPELTRDKTTNKLKAVLTVSDQERLIWFNDQTPIYCGSQHLRFFMGKSQTHKDETWPDVAGLAEPLPGPTFRARVGDIVEITFLNQVNLKNFPQSQYFDRAETGKGTGCDEVIGLYPQGGTINDTFPNCFHGSSTANIHFHGTHTNPSTTGDNVLIQIRPSLRKDGGKGGPEATEASVHDDFKEFFDKCEEHLAHVPSQWPTRYEQLPEHYRNTQKDWITEYDKTVPDPQKLWPPNERAIKNLQWPQFYVGAYPYCFQIPEYKKAPTDNDDLQMGQSPGTHWYHMHKHGSTTLNVNNTLIGAFVIEGKYDDDLNKFYNDDSHKNWHLDQKVMVIQQVGITPNMERAKSRGAFVFSVNGRREPVIDMKPGQTQLWRIVNGSARSAAYFFKPTGGLQWVQIAQDGVQFNVKNYHPPAAGAASTEFFMSAGNRVDLLVRVPKETAKGDYNIQVLDVIESREFPGGSKAGTPATLLTVRVSDPDAAKDPDPEMPFIAAADFPTFPDFLGDIKDDKIHLQRELTFNSTKRSLGASHTINGQKFGDLIDQAMLLNSYEEWKIVNTTDDGTSSPGPIIHPFHIHINPFQVVEIFDPWDPHYNFDDPKNPCYVNPADSTTWHSCDATKLSSPYVWWDVFAMPGARVVGGKTISGYFRMRSRFSDYTGQYVLHCHILAHEDRGMMQLLEVVPNKSLLSHH